MDVLSEVLRVVKLQSAFFFNAEFSKPWGFLSPESCRLAPYINESTGHIIIYHLLIEGHATAKVGEERLPLEAGDIVIFPQGSEHILENGRASDVVDGEQQLVQIFSGGLQPSKMGGGGEVTRFVCGYMVCEPQMSEVFLAGLPKMFKVNIRTDESGQWLENSIRFAIAAASATGAGGDAVVAKLCETLFIETLRRYVVQVPGRQKGWLAGAKDPEVGRVLTLMHSRPEEAWTIANLAAEVGLSRSVLAARFREYLGEPPMAYLSSWRLQLGSQILNSTSHSVAQVAAEVGYESEQAFNRAFKKKFGEPPARYRNRAKSAATL